MKRGNLYRVYRPSRQDPEKYRIFAVVSRQTVIDSKFSTVVCVPVYTRFDGLSTQIPLSVVDGLKHESSLHCDELISLPKAMLTDYIGTLSEEKLSALNESLKIALALTNEE